MPKKHDPSPTPPPPLPRAAPASALLRPRRNDGFTLAELLVVIGIIALLVSILVPVIGRVRISGQAADTAALLRAIDAAIMAYHGDHTEWPGPLGNDQLGLAPTAALPATAAGTDGFYRGALMGADQGVTGSENLVLGLLGGLVPVDDDSDPTTPPVIQYDPAAVGRGPVKLGGRSSGASRPYFDGRAANLSMHTIGDADVDYAAASTADAGLQWGRFVEEGAAASDSIIPEFTDRFSNPLPILYMRARPVGRITADNIDERVVSDAAEDNPVFMHSEIDPYIVANGVISIGIGKNPEKPYYVGGARVEEVPGAMPYYHGLQLDGYPSGVTAPAVPDTGSLPYLRDMMSQGSASYTYPYDARAYFLHPSEANARQADRYVLISAGPDRTYGTEDDITNFGSVP